MNEKRGKRIGTIMKEDPKEKDKERVSQEKLKETGPKEKKSLKIKLRKKNR